MSDGGAAARTALLTGLSMALEMLAAKVLPHGDVAREIAALVAEAEELATQAWALSTARMPDGARAVELARAFKSFIADATDLSDRAARAAAGSREVAATMQRHSADLAAMATGFQGSTDIAALRAQLRPLATSLEQLPARLHAGKELAEDVAELCTRATELAAQGEALERSNRNPAAAALAAYRGLRGFAETAGTIARTMLGDAEKVRGAISGLVERAGQFSSAQTATEAQRRASADGRLQDVVAQGRAAAQVATPRAAVPAKGVVWGAAAPGGS